MEQETRTARDAGAPVKIGAEAVRAAAEVLRRYRAGKQNLDRRIIDNEQFWKLRHWEQMEKAGEGGNPEDVRPASGWLVNCILSKHADAMDCYPEPTVLPREPGDRQEAETLSRILPVLLKNDRFRRTYSKAWWDKLKSGCAVYGVFWDNEKLHGLGDVSIRSMGVLNLFWEPGVTDIQESEHFFCTELVPNNHLVRRWPELEGKLGRGGAQVSRYLFDDKVDTSEQSLVVDWYYHTEREGRQVLQYCKFVGENVLYATENDPEMAARGWYDHGKYPFVFDTLFPEEGTPCGYGYVDLCKSAQKQIDLMNQAILKNTLAAATPRFFIRADGAVNENEYADWTRPFVHTNGNLGADSIAPIRVPALDSVYVAVLQNKIAEMKETAGNRDVMSGGTAGGVTAATAIAALQEAGGKLSRNMIDDGYEAFSQVVTLCIELIRQFYDVPRQFRLLGQLRRRAPYGAGPRRVWRVWEGHRMRGGVRAGVRAGGEIAGDRTAGTVPKRAGIRGDRGYGGLCPGVRVGAVRAGAAGAAIPLQGGSWVVTYHGEESSDGRAGKDGAGDCGGDGRNGSRRRGAAGTCRGTGGTWRWRGLRDADTRPVQGGIRRTSAANTGRTAAGTAAGEREAAADGGRGGDGAAAGAGGAAAGRDGIRGDPGAAADGPGHCQRRQPRGGERRTAQERQPLGPEGPQRGGAGGDTEESTGWREDQILERERKHGDEFADVCGEHPDHSGPERGDEDLLRHGAAGERQTAAGAQPVRGHKGPACRRRQDRGVA